MKGKAGCSVTCKLGEIGNCETPFFGSRISISSSHPFGITTVNNIIEGYSESFCLRCESNFGSQVFDYDGIIVT